MGRMRCVREQVGERGTREVRGGQIVMKNIVSWEEVRQRREKGGKSGERNAARAEQREGCMLWLLDG